jgi:hypothetical protein
VLLTNGGAARDMVGLEDEDLNPTSVAKSYNKLATIEDGRSGSRRPPLILASPSSAKADLQHLHPPPALFCNKPSFVAAPFEQIDMDAAPELHFDSGDCERI